MTQQKSRQKGKTIKVTITVVIVLLILGGIYADMTKKTPVQTATARQGTIRQYVEERARTSLPHVYHVTMPELGRINPIVLREGATVTNNQLITTLDKADLNDAMTEMNEVVDAMLNAYNASLAQIKASQTRQEFAKWLWDAQKQLYANAQTSELEEKKAQKEYLESEVSLEENQATSYAMKALYSATKLLPIYVNRRIKRTDITSPIDGVILKRYVWNEKVMQPGDPILDIGDLSQLQVTADILTEQAVTIAEGDDVEIYGETIGPKPIRGKVIRIKPEGFTKVSSLGVEQQRVPVIIEFNTDDIASLTKAGRTLGLEFRVHVRIFTAAADHAVIIPRTALFRGNGGIWQAFVIRNGKTERISLETGLVNDQDAQITKGLQAGDQVVIAPESTLKSGTRVAPQNIQAYPSAGSAG